MLARVKRKLRLKGKLWQRLRMLSENLVTLTKPLSLRRRLCLVLPKTQIMSCRKPRRQLKSSKFINQLTKP